MSAFGRTLAVLAIVFCTPVAGQELSDIERATLNPLAATDPAQFEAFADRPLFSPSRRVPAAAVLAPAPVSPPPNLQLIGVLDISGLPKVLLTDRDSGRMLTVEVGETIGQWTLQSVSSDKIVLSSGDQRTEFELFEPANTVPTTPTSSASKERSSLANATGDELLKIIRERGSLAGN